MVAVGGRYRVVNRKIKGLATSKSFTSKRGTESKSTQVDPSKHQNTLALSERLPMSGLARLCFKDSLVRDLPADASTGNQHVAK